MNNTILCFKEIPSIVNDKSCLRVIYYTQRNFHRLNVNKGNKESICWSETIDRLINSSFNKERVWRNKSWCVEK